MELNENSDMSNMDSQKLLSIHVYSPVFGRKKVLYHQFVKNSLK